MKTIYLEPETYTRMVALLDAANRCQDNACKSGLTLAEKLRWQRQGKELRAQALELRG